MTRAYRKRDIQFEVPKTEENYRIIKLEGRLYRQLPTRKVPFGAVVIFEDMTEHPECWALERYHD